MQATHDHDTPALRKARGAFFTPAAVADHIVAWAVRDAADLVLEPSTGDAAFLVAAVARLKDLSAEPSCVPLVHGAEIHQASAHEATANVEAAGGRAMIEVGDFFALAPAPRYDAVVGNPPYIRYQDFTGTARGASREAALKAGVSLTALASSWAAFTVYSTLFLREGGRLGLVLPAELLSVNYAAPVRRYLFEHFQSVELVLFERQVFPEAEADVVLLLADGYGSGSTDHAVVHQVVDADGLSDIRRTHRWTPTDPGAKWTSLLVGDDASQALARVARPDSFEALEEWGDTTLGMVTGNNRFFALSPRRAAELRIPENELLPLSPPGSAHLRRLELTEADLRRLGAEGKSTRLFRPPASGLSRPASAYVRAGHVAGVDEAYKCRVRTPWWRVPLLAPADLLLTCMNADTPRLTTNTAGAYHLNSVHGVYLRDDRRALGRELLPLASINSVTQLSAELVGRSYGGGVLKIEPREADVWLVPSLARVVAVADALRGIRGQVLKHLDSGDLPAATALVDEVLFVDDSAAATTGLAAIREAHRAMTGRRLERGRSV